MSVAKVIEVIAEGSSVEAAVQAALEEAQKSVRGIQGIYIKDTKALVSNNTITGYRVNCKVTFVVE